MQKRIFLGINIFIIIAVFIGNFFYQRAGFTLGLKSLCSILFASLGIINLIYAYITKQKNMKFFIFMSLGLLLAMAGDIILGFNFIIGAATFALGHVCYFIAYFMYSRLKRLDLIIIIVLAILASLFVGFFPLLEFDNLLMKIVCVIYAIIISIMVGKAIGNAIAFRNSVTIIIAVGSILFFISDLMLVFNWFMNCGKWSSHLCMATYYPANCALAFSMLMYIFKEKEEQLF